jgi:hypothetical protein
MEIERAGTFVEVAGKVVQMNPSSAFDGLRGVTDAHTEFHDSLAGCDVAHRNLVPARDVFQQADFTRLRAEQLACAIGIVEKSGDVVMRLNLERAWFHLRLICIFSLNRKERNAALPRCGLGVSALILGA